eukprot:2587246-Ditylum_brightwellii.AAC.1
MLQLDPIRLVQVHGLRPDVAHGERGDALGKVPRNKATRHLVAAIDVQVGGVNPRARKVVVCYAIYAAGLKAVAAPGLIVALAGGARLNAHAREHW